MTRHASFRSRGLSLVELLLALALAAMMLAPLAALTGNMAAASAAAADRTALARDAEFALTRIANAVRATPSSMYGLPANSGTDDSGSWFNVEFKWENGQLVQKNPDGVLADNVVNFAITAPWVEEGQQLVQVSLTLARNDVAVSSGMTLRLGGMR